MKESGDKRRVSRDDILLEEAKEALAYCRSAEELCRIAHVHLDRLFPDARACIYLADASGTRFVTQQVCECQRGAVAEFRHYECWAICRGTAHAAGTTSDSSLCSHVKATDEPLWHSLCLPLFSGSSILGLMHIEHAPKQRTGNGERKVFHGPAGLRLLSGVAQEIATMLASLNAGRPPGMQ